MSNIIPERDHGIDGWYRAVEINGEAAERLRVGDCFRASYGRLKIVGISKKYKPIQEDGVVVLVMSV